MQSNSFKNTKTWHKLEYMRLKKVKIIPIGNILTILENSFTLILRTVDHGK